MVPIAVVHIKKHVRNNRVELRCFEFSYKRKQIIHISDDLIILLLLIISIHSAVPFLDVSDYYSKTCTR